MTDRIPYESERSDFSVVLAIAQGKLPAAINNLPIPDFGRQVLEKCWSPEATSRPTMTWCSEVLSRQTPALFTVYYKECRTNIPSEYMSEGDGWCQIRNPDSEKLYEFELLPSLQDNPNPYVAISLLSLLNPLMLLPSLLWAVQLFWQVCVLS